MCGSERRARGSRLGLLALCALLGAVGCNDSNEAGADVAEDVGPGPIDADVDAGAPCEVMVEGVCIDGVQARCAWAAGLGDDCPDLDGDCAPSCARAPAAARDCDDSRVDVHPFAAELCTGRDDDCDGMVDEGYAVGVECEQCGRVGKTECAVDAVDDVACSVAPGQSEAVAFEVERCDGVDDDCDGVVDEQCALDSPGPAPVSPTVCPDGRIAMVQGGALVVATPLGEGGYQLDTVRDAVEVAHPRCGGAGLAWLELGDGGCSTPEGGPLRCAAELWAAFGDAAPVMLASLGSLGPPRVGDDAVYWHTIAGDAPALLARGVGDGSARRFVEGPYSDPTPPVEVDGALYTLARHWPAPEAGELRVPRVSLVRIMGSVQSGVDNPGSTAGTVSPPMTSEGWFAWRVVGETTADIWVVDATQPRHSGFFPLTGTGERGEPRLAGDRLVWLDTATTPATLRAFDLGTGVERVLATGEIAPDGFALGADVVVWVDEADGLLRRRGLAPIGQTR